MTSELSFVAAFVAGLLSFLSPCVLPLIPAYLSFMTGLTTTELAQERDGKADVLIPAILFVLGLTVVFVAMGATASVLGRVLIQYRDIVEKVAGVVVILFGVFMLGFIKLPWLYAEARLDMEKSRSFGRGAAFVMGLAFAAGWTPCVGPILGTILTLAASTASLARGAILLAFYSAGLGVPFILFALLFGRLQGFLKGLNRWSLVINRVAGAFLILTGVLIFTGTLGKMATWLTTVLPTIEV